VSRDWLARLSRADQFITRWSTAIRAFFLAVAAALAVVFLLLPQLKPDEPCKGQTLDAQLTDVAVDRSVTYGGYLKLTRQSPAGYSQPRLQQVGKLISFQVTATGYKGKRLPVRWTTERATGEPVRDPALNDQLALEVKPEACTDSGSELAWARDPTQPGAYKVVLRLFDAKNQPLRKVQTGVFRISRRR
jgi:hypothetical protein